MMEINQRKRLFFIRLKDNYFAPSIKKEDPGYDVVYYFHCKEYREKSQIFNTLFIDLTREKEDILSSFDRTTKQVVRKMIRENFLVLEMIENPNKSELEEFRTFFNDFAYRKKIRPCDDTLIENLIKISSFKISKVSFNGQVLCMFGFITDKERVCVQYESSIRFSCNDCPETIKLSGKASKMLEYFSMIYFKDKGFKTYDLCGLTLNPDNKEMENIDRRKKGFGGTIVKEYNFMYPLTLKGKIFVWMKHFHCSIYKSFFLKRS
ncbi:hypothetical protein J2Z35_001000 [Acetoanaerobium pronyense]|uniref:BioF2-like acetyltransferase domain-containing protein n=1 Tax=Acetoanaerobium pronyense TaxID=1482736 RepID=A0ABS4KHF1_9FIRM|nr:hypothetical protein [Acetoanaerobium pronyense]MBP2027206.1 hypothetical protein [Acetoanaerobium pronyense]